MGYHNDNNPSDDDKPTTSSSSRSSDDDGDGKSILTKVVEFFSGSGDTHTTDPSSADINPH